MSISYGFYNSLNHDRLYDATQFGSIFDGIINDGVYASYGDCFLVKAATEENTVNVYSGRAWFNHTWTLNDSILTLTDVPTPPLVRYRYDALILEINSSERVNSLKWLSGKEVSTAAGAKKPTLTKTDEIHQYPFCYILRRPNATVINQVDIENVVGTDECPFVTGIIETVSTSELVAQWAAQWEVFKNDYENAATLWKSDQESDFTTWRSDQESDFTTWSTTQKNEFASWMAGEKTDFDTWFANLEYVLDGDAAGHLQNEIDTLNQKTLNMVDGRITVGQKSNVTIGTGATSEGISTVATGGYSHAEGNLSRATGQFSHAEGNNNKAIGDDSHAEGLNNTVEGDDSHIEGVQSVNYAMGAHVEGYQTHAAAGADYSHVEGSGHDSINHQTTYGAFGFSCHVEGRRSTATGDFSHVEGIAGTAEGEGAHVEGYGSVGEGKYSHTEGVTNGNKGIATHVEGGYNMVEGNYSHVGGYGIESRGDYVFVHGNNGDLEPVGDTSSYSKWSNQFKYANIPIFAFPGSRLAYEPINYNKLIFKKNDGTPTSCSLSDSIIEDKIYDIETSGINLSIHMGSDIQYIYLPIARSANYLLTAVGDLQTSDTPIYGHSLRFITSTGNADGIAISVGVKTTNDPLSAVTFIKYGQELSQYIMITLKAYVATNLTLIRIG